MFQKALIPIFLVVCIMAGAVIWQLPAYRHDVAAAEQANLDIPREIEIALAAKRNLVRLREDIEAMEAEVARLTVSLPETLDVEARLAEYGGWWERFGCQICGVEEEDRLQRGSLETATIALEVCCPLSQLRLLSGWAAGCRYPKDKIMVVSDAEFGERSLRFQATFPAWTTPDFGPPSPRQPLPLPEPTTKLWPFTALSRQAQEGLSELHAKMISDYWALKDAEILERRRGQVSQYIEVIESMCGPTASRQER